MATESCHKFLPTSVRPFVCDNNGQCRRRHHFRDSEQQSTSSEYHFPRAAMFDACSSQRTGRDAVKCQRLRCYSAVATEWGTMPRRLPLRVRSEPVPRNRTFAGIYALNYPNSGHQRTPRSTLSGSVVVSSACSYKPTRFVIRFWIWTTAQRECSPRADELLAAKWAGSRWAVAAGAVAAQLAKRVPQPLPFWSRAAAASEVFASWKRCDCVLEDTMTEFRGTRRHAANVWFIEVVRWTWNIKPTSTRKRLLISWTGEVLLFRLLVIIKNKI